MSRPLRIEFAGALYHVTSRGDRRESIFVDDEDRQALLGMVAQGLERFDAQMLAYCLMGNHLLQGRFKAILVDRDAYLLGHDAHSPEHARRAAEMYAHWVAAGRNVQLWEGGLNRQVFLGDRHFVECMQALMTSKDSCSVESVSVPVSFSHEHA